MGPPPERPQQSASSNGPALVVASGPPLGPKPSRLNQQGRSSKWGTKRNSRDKDSARKLTKADIGMPLDFRHVTHVGWDPNKGFDLDNVEDPQLKEFFVKAGVSVSQLNDPETRDFIYDFINKHGGIEAVKESFQLPDLPQAVVTAPPQTGPPPPVPARSAPLPSEAKIAWGTGQVRNAPPPPPSRTQATPAVPTSGAAPPLPPSRNPPPPKPPTPQEAAPMAMAPPPPPPPPMLPHPEQKPVTPPPPSAMPAGAPDPRSALLDAIKMGKQLKVFVILIFSVSLLE
ncbi:hypothetical protein B566_EDAN014676 [Ephemera danica]|nr:hypothetical protein B566_EDAN014676 [Ephemera danica]